jgi:hypothetical protein
MALESPEAQLKRWSDLEALQEHYSDFRDFYYDCSVDLLGFVPTEQQLDIANYISKGPFYLMVQAQRGEAKTTITGCFAVYQLIHQPRTRVLIVSAGTPLAKEISTWCIQIINGMEVLECLRVDTSHDGARNSVEAYDVHHTLKGPDKSPSIACVGITSNLQGRRADLLIADDIESTKNSKTALMREQLQHLTKDFTSINQKGRIIYLGTPQSTESVYNDLPARGFSVRIWPGRYPTEEEEQNYGEHLAPLIKTAMVADPSLREGGGPLGDRGKPTDPGMMSEVQLTKKEVDQGKPYFNLQHMLDTALTDADRYPLRLSDFLFYSFNNEDAPEKFSWAADPTYQINHAVGSPVKTVPIYRPAKTSETFLPWTYKVLAVDPAGGGQNGDETGVAVCYGNSCGWIAGMYVGGVPGGTTQGKLDQIINLAIKWECHDIIVEKNYGGDAWPNAITRTAFDKEWPVTVEQVWSAGQKELRIIDTLEPLLGAHKLVINTDVLNQDVHLAQKYPQEKRAVYQFMHQAKHITRERGALEHEDRLEAFSMAVKYLHDEMKKLQTKDTPMQPPNRFKGFVKDSSGRWVFSGRAVADAAVNVLGGTNIMQRFRR